MYTFEIIITSKIVNLIVTLTINNANSYYDISSWSTRVNKSQTRYSTLPFAWSQEDLNPKPKDLRFTRLPLELTCPFEI